MVHQEEAYLRIWLDYYGKMLGRENLYVITHGGDPAIVEMAEGCRLVYLPRFAVDGTFDLRRFEVLNAYANFLLTHMTGLSRATSTNWSLSTRHSASRWWSSPKSTAPRPPHCVLLA